ncbi:hypothetical protein KAR91_19430 [Candidatus Pacearchaeota archaeon]|nr:hypothetical protein [Candidatus Pacearchaeota archaeon]
MELFDESKFSTKKDLIAFLVKNKESIIAQKKAEMKKADCVSFAPVIIHDKNSSTKANEPINVSDLNLLKVEVIINTSNLLDGHGDVHIPGLWKKSLKENKMIMHLQEHAMRFDKIISDGKNLKAFTRDFTWTELGVNFEGNTQALTFESTIERKRNEFMLEQYGNGYVKNHSVGMRYVQLVFCVNDDNWGAEFEAWEKYFPMVANQDAAEEKGFFWAVKEAKVLEGSAVPFGSNPATPTLDNDLKEEPPNKDEPEATQDEPEATQEKKSTQAMDWDRIVKLVN